MNRNSIHSQNLSELKYKLKLKYIEKYWSYILIDSLLVLPENLWAAMR